MQRFFLASFHIFTTTCVLFKTGRKKFPTPCCGGFFSESKIKTDIKRNWHSCTLLLNFNFEIFQGCEEKAQPLPRALRDRDWCKVKNWCLPLLILDHWIKIGFDPKIVLIQNLCVACWLGGRFRGIGVIQKLSDPKIRQGPVIQINLIENFYDYSTWSKVQRQSSPKAPQAAPRTSTGEPG